MILPTDGRHGQRRLFLVYGLMGQSARLLEFMRKS